MTAVPKGPSQKLQGPSKWSWDLGWWGSVGVPSSLGPTVGDSRKAGEQVQLGFLLSSVPLPACWAIWFLPPLPHGGGFSLPTTPKTVTPLSFPGQVGDAGFRKTGAVDSGRTLGGDPKGLG